ncbi:GIP, partial [Symbiodinium sp. KB8]
WRLVGEDGEVLSLNVVKGCPEIPEETAVKLITMLEAKQLPELKSTTATSIKAISDVRQSWCSRLLDYVKIGNTECARRAIDKAEFLGYKAMVKNDLAIRQLRQGQWEVLKGLALNRRARKRLLRAASWIVRWDPPCVERRQDHLRHLGYVGDTVYLNVNTLLAENEFVDVWRVLWLAAIQGRIGAVVARDAADRPLDQLMVAPHRNKVHFLHAMSVAGRMVRGGEVVSLYVEDAAVSDPRTSTSTTTSAPWREQPDTKAYFSEMGIADAVVDSFSGEHAARRAEMDSDEGSIGLRPILPPTRFRWILRVRSKDMGFRQTENIFASSLSVPSGFRWLKEVLVEMTIYVATLYRTVMKKCKKSFQMRSWMLWRRSLRRRSPPDYSVEEQKKEAEEWEKMKAAFKAPLKTETIYFCVPVNGKKAVYTLPALQQMVVEIKALGYPVVRVHSDRGGEFRGNLVKRWLAGQGRDPSRPRTSEDSLANGCANGGNQAEMFEAWNTRSMPRRHGAKVCVKVKKYKTGDVESFTPHWLQGKYLGPSTDVRGGHVVLKPSGTFLTTAHVRVTTDPPPLDSIVPTVYVEPEPPVAPPLPPPDHEPPPGAGIGDDPLLPPPIRRARFKGPALRHLQLFLPDVVPMDEVQQCIEDYELPEPRLCQLRAKLVYELETLAAEMIQEGPPTLEGCTRLLENIGSECGNLKVPRVKDGIGMVVGAYVHGGSFGVTNYGKDLKWTAMYLNKYLLIRLKETLGDGDYAWTTLALQHAAEVPQHRDVHNQLGSRNYVIELKTDKHAGLWVEDGQDQREVLGGEHPTDFQWCTEDGEVRDGCLVDIKNVPASFNPRRSHGYIRDAGQRWFLSAYTPHGAFRLSEADKRYLESCGFPLPDPLPPTDNEVLETRPMLKATFFPRPWEELDGVRSFGSDVEVSGVVNDDDDEVCGDWGIYVEEEDDSDVGVAALRTSQHVMNFHNNAEYQEDVEECVEEWLGDHGCLNPRLAKMEPEFTNNIEQLIKDLTESETPLRHTHNVSPHEVRQAMEAWSPAIKKELGVVEKGFYRSTASAVEEMKRTSKVQELPAKLVYTLKPPAGDVTDNVEAKYCKRKALRHSGPAGHLRFGCGGGKLEEVVYVIHPPAILIKLGLAEEGERWTIKDLRFTADGKEWKLRQGDAEPSLWMLVPADSPEEDPGALVLIYVDDILLCGRLGLLKTVAQTFSATWKTTELDLLTELHGVRFLGCEILTTASYDRYYLHQRPYIKEILRAHDIPQTSCSPAQAPRHLVTFEAEPDEPKGNPDEVKMAQRLCGELLWLAQRTRPDVSFTVNAMGALISRAAPRCIAIGLKLMAYLQHTQDYILAIEPVNDDLVAYTGVPLAWRATRTPYVCLSTAESELTAAIEGLKMTLSLGAVLEEIAGKELKITLAIDNQSTIAIAKPSGSTSWRTRHLRVRAAFIREQVQEQKVVVKYVKGQQQFADLLTKSFPKQRLEELVSLWGMGRLCEGAKSTMLIAMVVCMMVQTARAQEPGDESLAINTSLELYIMIVVVGIAMAGLWEFVLRRLRESVRQEIEAQIGGYDEPDADGNRDYYLILIMGGAEVRGDVAHQQIRFFFGPSSTGRGEGDARPDHQQAVATMETTQVRDDSVGQANQPHNRVEWVFAYSRVEVTIFIKMDQAQALPRALKWITGIGEYFNLRSVGESFAGPTFAVPLTAVRGRPSTTQYGAVNAASNSHLRTDLASGSSSLFNAEALQRLRAMEGSAPLLYSPSDANAPRGERHSSDSSDLPRDVIQQEVARQLSELTNRVQAAEAENQQLRQRLTFMTEVRQLEEDHAGVILDVLLQEDNLVQQGLGLRIGLDGVGHCINILGVTFPSVANFKRIAVAGAGYSHQHRQIEHPSISCLNVDVIGPLRYPGLNPDQRGKAPRPFRYCLVGDYRFAKIPRVQGIATDEEIQRVLEESQKLQLEPVGEQEIAGQDPLQEEGEHTDLDEYVPSETEVDEDLEQVAMPEEVAAADVGVAEDEDDPSLGAAVPPDPLDRVIEDLQFSGESDTLLFAVPLYTPIAMQSKRRAPSFMDPASTVAMQQRERLGMLTKLLAPFGHDVLAKEKRFHQQRANVDSDWKKYKYLGLSSTTPGAHFLVRQVGERYQLTHTRGVRVGAEDPPDVLPPLRVDESPSPRRRIVGKRPAASVEAKGVQVLDEDLSLRAKLQAVLSDWDPVVARTRHSEVVFTVKPPNQGALETEASMNASSMSRLRGLAAPKELWLLRLMTFETDEGLLCLKQSSGDENVWMLQKVDEEEPEVKGYILVYVDDILLAMPLSLMHGGAGELLGLDVVAVDGGFFVTQETYVDELARIHNPHPPAVTPLTREECSFEMTSSDVPPTPEVTLECQQRAGELLWLSQRSRPDIAFTSALVFSLSTRAPARTIRVAQRALRYVASTRSPGILFVSRGEAALDIYTDASFAPGGTKSHTGYAVFYRNVPVLWRSARQGLITLSTAESEHIALQEGAVAGFP